VAFFVRSNLFCNNDTSCQGELRLSKKEIYTPPMLQDPTGHPEQSSYPSLIEILIFRSKATLLQLRAGIINRWVKPVQKHPKASVLLDQPVIAELITPLRSSDQDTLEDRFVIGKIQNLRVALQQIHGIEIPKNGVFSFWKQIGQPIQRRGYVIGRELRQGCLIPSIGGGLCQLSNALYSLALNTGIEIIERHAHTQIIPGSLAEIGQDATVFWNYVDLRFKVHEALRIEAVLTSDALVVRFRGQTIESAPKPIMESQKVKSFIDTTHQCDTCNVTACIRHSPQTVPQKSLGRTAYLVDEYWPEFDRYIQTHRTTQDLLALPLQGQRWHKANYAWNPQGFQQVKTATLMTLRRSLASRQLSAQGKSRQQQLFKNDQQLAKAYTRWLTYDVTHIVVMQHLLPFLWREGHLGGRTFDVLMTRLPLSVLQDRLDQAHCKHPQSLTLGDFRTNPELVEAENRALQSARRLITPHTDIAKLFPQKTTLLDWLLPIVATPPTSGKSILFPASTLGRKGAYDLREVAQALDLQLHLLGTELEGENFWDSVKVSRSQIDPLTDIGLVVLPAYVEHNPRLLLRAIAHRIPVIASTACGLAQVPGVTSIPTGDLSELKQAIQSLMDS
jgi:VanW like protein